MGNDMTKSMLGKLARISKDAKIKISGNVDNDTRKGNYLNVQSGLSNITYFIGYDENDELIVEFVN
ncbi:MAG: hypothetical protein ACOC2W_00665 [bacterium]